MSKWEFLAYLAVMGTGVLAFLRIVANEIATQEREIERQRQAEAARKPQREPETHEPEILVARAA